MSHFYGLLVAALTQCHCVHISRLADPRLQSSRSTRHHLSDPKLFSRGKLLKSPSFKMSSDNPASFCTSEAIARFRSVLASVMLFILSSTPESANDFNLAFEPSAYSFTSRSQTRPLKILFKVWAPLCSP